MTTNTTNTQNVHYFLSQVLQLQSSHSSNLAFSTDCTVQENQHQRAPLQVRADYRLSSFGQFLQLIYFIFLKMHFCSFLWQLWTKCTNKN